MNEENIITISSEAPAEPGMNYQLLRKEGLVHLQRLAGKIWTDYNSHDPGVTILEQLCYVLTDLSYRIDYDMPELLAVPEGDPYRCLYSPAEILTTKPVTVTDLRKKLVDIKGVQNAWIEALEYPDDYFYYDKEQQLLTFEQLEENAVKTKGFYRALIQKDKESGVEDTPLMQEVEQCIQRNRKLCEDFREIRLLDTQKVSLKAVIEIGAVDDADLLLAQIYRKTADYMAPYIRFYTLNEMLDRGKRIDEIMEGPVLRHGFIDTEEIKQLDKRKDLRISDIVHEIMQIPGVKVIKNIAMRVEEQGEEQYIDWVLNLDQRKAPEFDVENAEITLVKDDLEATIDKVRTIELYHGLKEDTLYPALEEQDRNFILPEGNDRDIENYYPFQNYFPLTYGVGEAGLASSDPKRKGQAKQLKAYLLFFEQLLANYFSQITHFKDLMDFYNPDIKTYFAQTLSGLPGIENLLQKPVLYEQWLKKIGEDEGGTIALDRKNRFLDHLLARFCEQFTDYSLIVYGSLESNRYSPPEKQIHDKQILLQEYPKNSAGHAHAYDYTQPVSNDTNIAGLQKRLSNLLGIPRYQKRSLLEDFNTVKTDINLVYKGVKDRHLYELLRLGLSREQYRFNTRTHKIEIIKEADETVSYSSPSLRFTDPNVMATTKEQYPEATYDRTVDELIARWQQWNSDLEGFYVMEHLLLCPQTNRQGGVFLEYASDITATRRSKIGNGVRFTSPGHNLMHNEEIKIFDSEGGTYNGTYRVYNVQKDYFEIAHPDITAPSNKARWMRTSLYKEPYSLQLSIVFPDWPARFRDSSFREYITQTVRREVPAHIQVSVSWFSRFDDIPDESWTKEETRAYMDRLFIPYSTTDTQQDLLNKIPGQTAMEQWEKDYFPWLQKKALYTGQPAENWTKEDILIYLQHHGISGVSGDTMEELRNKAGRFIQNTRKWKLLYNSGEPDKNWSERELRALMDIFGIPYTTDDAQQDLLKSITYFRRHYRKWRLLSNTGTIDTLWTIQAIKEWMDIFQLPYHKKDLKNTLLSNISQFREKARKWLNQTEFPDDSWTPPQLKQLMDTFAIPYGKKDTLTELHHKIIRYDRRFHSLTLWSSQPDNTWPVSDLKLYMHGLGIAYPEPVTKEIALEHIEDAVYHYGKWDLLKGEPGQWAFPENSRKWTKAAICEFASEFDIDFNEDDTKAEVVAAIARFEQQMRTFSDPDPNNLQYHAGKMLHYLRVGSTPLPYAFNEAGTIRFNATQYINLTDFDLVDSGNRPALKITAEQTIEMWIKPAMRYEEERTADQQQIYGRITEPGVIAESILLNSSGTLAYCYNSDTIEFPNPIPSHSWTHIAVVRNRNKVTLLLNGEKVNEASITKVRSFGKRVHFFIGGKNSFAYTGKIAELRLWNTAKLQQDILDKMQSPLSGNEEGLQGYWKLNETLGNMAIDSTPNANHGVMARFLALQEIDSTLEVIPKPETIRYKGKAVIAIQNSQPGVWYQLRVDNETNTHWGNPREGNGHILIFEVNGLERAETFNVLAGKTTDHQLNGLGGERVQLDTTAEIQVQPKTDLNVMPLDIILDYNGQTEVTITGSQSGVSYQLHLYEDTIIGAETGASKEGNNGPIILTSGNLQEDTQLCIVATNID